MVVVRNEDEVGKSAVEKAVKTAIQWLIDRRDGSPNIELRKFTIEAGGFIPSHMHEDLEHIQYVLRGRYKVVVDGREYIVKPGDAIYIPPGSLHSYHNEGAEPAEFLCIIPRKETYRTTWADENPPPPRC